MVKPRLLAPVLLATLALPAWAAPTASVDRTEIAPNETVTLTLENEGTGLFSRPDLTPLTQDFTVLNNSQRSSISIVNGDTRGSVQWIITLQPLRSGRLTIPGLTIGGESTQPIDITVQDNPGGQPDTAEANGPVTLESELDRPRAFVQSQVLLTLRLVVNAGVTVTDIGVEDPVIEGAILQKLDPREYLRKVDGGSQKVLELRYAVFPQQPGTLALPPLRITGTATQGPRSLFTPFFGQGDSQAVQLSSKHFEVEVLPLPKGVPQDRWLSASALELSEKWSSDNPTLRVGEALTRTVTARAEGALAGNLPALLPGTLNGATLYPERPRTEQSESRAGTVGRRIESQAILPTQPGTLTLPPVVVTWWDNQTGEPREAHLPGRTLTVLPAAAQADNAHQLDATTAPPAEDTPGPDATPPEVTPDYRWQLLSGALAIGWLATALLAWRWRRRPALAANFTDTPQPPARQPDTHALQNAVRDACAKNDASACRRALLAWAAAQWPESPPTALEAFASHCGDSALAEALRALDQHLFGTQPAPWQGQPLREIFDRWSPAQDKKKGATKDALETLYPVHSSGRR